MNESQYILPLCIAAALGLCMGLERSLSGKHAGMRTYALVAMGSCLFVIVGTLGSFELSVFSGINPMQIAGSVVLGVGFLGAGLAVFRGEHPVELTTAAGLWVTAGVGMACAYMFYALAITTTVLAILIFSVFAKVERALNKRYGTRPE